MAKFGNLKVSETISKVAKESQQKANVFTIKLINNKNLNDFHKNGEDLKDTIDLEESIKQLGFTDPIEVTSYGNIEGEYTIVSGHRRRVAGVKMGMDTFPCIVKEFNSEEELRNYVLLANSQRDSAKDPLLFAKRYKMHEEYLKEIDFKGKYREEIAKRLGISTQQADRYNQFNKIIMGVWEMVRKEEIGMSSVLGMATLEREKQSEVYALLQEALKEGISLNRENCNTIIKAYKDGKRNLKDILKKEEENKLKDSGMPLNSMLNTEPGETKDNSEKQNARNNEVRREGTGINGKPTEHLDDEFAHLGEDDDEEIEDDDIEDLEEIENDDIEEEEDKKPVEEKKDDESPEEKLTKILFKTLSKLEETINDDYRLKDGEEAMRMINSMECTMQIMADEIANLSYEYNLKNSAKNTLKKLSENIIKTSNLIK